MKEPIRVLAIVCKLVPGGLETRLMDIIRNIDKDRVIIDVFTYRMEPGTYDEEVKALGGKVYYNPPLTVKNMFWYVGYFREFLSEHPEYRIVHAHQDAWCSVFCKGAYLAGVPARIAHSRTAIKATRLNHHVKNIIKQPIKKYANYFFAVSENAGRWLYGNKMYEQGKVEIWPNAIDASKYYYNSETRIRVREDNHWKNKYVIMHVGNFTPPKNHPFILTVFKEVYKRDKSAILVLVGKGEHEKLDKYIEENSLNGAVVFLGRRTDVNELLQGADVFLFPSIFEGLPGALVEAQAAGLPCVISDTIANEVHILPCIKVKSLRKDADSWADDVLAYRDYNRKDMREYIEKKGFDINSLTQKLCEFYESVYG